MIEYELKMQQIKERNEKKLEQDKLREMQKQQEALRKKKDVYLHK